MEILTRAHSRVQKDTRNEGQRSVSEQVTAENSPNSHKSANQSPGSLAANTQKPQEKVRWTSDFSVTTTASERHREDIFMDEREEPELYTQQ